MTNYCKSNVRRVINYTNHEPVNKYDLWLSENLRYNEYGELEYDNNGQPACDLILKIFRNGQWEPIVGYNTAAGNKINIVNGVTYNGKTGYTQNHLPLFRSPSDSPDELFDAGTIGQALDTYVSLSEWETLLDGHLGDAITYAFTYGNIRIRPAEANILGGIYATRYQGGYADSDNNATTYLTKCKYKYQAPTDYNLYVHAKEIMQTIHNYTEDHSDDPDFPGIVPPGVVPDDEVPTLLYNWFRNSPSIMKGWQELSPSLGGNKPRFEIWGTNRNNAGKILTLQPISWWDGPHPTGYDPYDISHNAINWISPDELFGNYSYTLQRASLSALGGIRADTHSGLLAGKYTAECKLYNPLHVSRPYHADALCVDIRDVKKALDDWYAENDSTALDLNVFADKGVDVEKYAWYDERTGTSELRYWYALNNYPLYNGLPVENKYPKTKNLGGEPTLYGSSCGLDWVGAQSIVEEGLGIGTGNAGYLYYNGSDFYLDPGTGGGGGGSVTLPPYLLQGNCNSQGERIIYVPNGGTGGNKKYLNGYGEWSVPPNTEYDVFEGADGTNPGLIGLVPRPLANDNTKFLKGDGTWATPTVNALFNINLALSIEDDSNFVLDGLRLISTSSSNPVNTTLEEWSYYNIDTGSKTIQFTFTNTHKSGNAIYLRINTDANPVLINTDADLILGNLTMSSSRKQFNANSSYLVTIQFGIIKIEMIASDRSTSENINS